MSEVLTIQIITDNLESIPEYADPGAAGMDLVSSTDEVIEFGDFKLVPTGIRVAIPQGYEGQIRPRSGLAMKYGIGILNSPGTIDSTYRGEIKVLLINHGGHTFHIRKGDRIAQLVVAPVTKVVWNVVESLSETSRGSGGFGSTGIRALLKR